MTRRRILAAGALAAPVSAQTPRFAKRKTVERFWGAWILASYEQISASGSISYPMGTEPVGRITYDAAGRMSAQLMRRDRPRFASNWRQQGSADEIRAAFQGYVGYYGPYTLNEKENKIIHHVECCSFPNWVGTDQVRGYEFDGDRLILRAPAPENAESKLIWVRAR
jgi:hypothetical protein